jgi:hypothetical protein
MTREQIELLVAKSDKHGIRLLKKAVERWNAGEKVCARFLVKRALQRVKV